MWNRMALLMTILMVPVTAASLLLIPIEVEARGGGRGGGGRGGGGRSAGGARGGGGGRTMNRTPSMSRASSRPAASQARQRPQSRPAGSQMGQRSSSLQGQQARHSIQQRPSAANRTELRNQVNRYSQGRPTQNIDRQAFAQKAQNFSSNRGNQITQNRQLSDRVSQNLQHSRPDSKDWFDRDFFDHHNIDLDYLRTGANWWRPVAWTTLATWGAWNWSTPYYYDDGGYAYPLSSAESTYPYPYSTTTTPSQPIQAQAQSIQSAQITEPTDGDWLPLGIFAVASDPNAAAQTNLFIQLAINRSGEIAGVLYNSVTDAAQDLTGMVDAKNQKAYWSMANRPDSPIASTGIYNLTEDQTTINVHFADGLDQTWILVRIQQEQ